MRLSDLQTSESGFITKVKGQGAFRRRINEMGFIKGKKVTVIKNAPLKDPIEYNIMGYGVSLRRSEASLIEVANEKDTIFSTVPFNGTIDEETLKLHVGERRKTINVALVGNPNAGKTSLFNHASNSREHVGNYSGVTIDSKVATFKQDGYTLNIVDLPGTYSLSAYSPEELYVRDYIYNNVPDVIINVVDASNLERNLYLTTQLIDMDVKVIIALNMYDELLAKGDRFDFVQMGKMLGIPITPTVSTNGRGIRELFQKVINVYNDVDPIMRHIHINYGSEIEQSLSSINKELSKPGLIEDVATKYSRRFIAIKLLEKDQHTKDLLRSGTNFKEIDIVVRKEIDRLESIYNEDSETIITDAKYGFIAGALKETYKEGVHTKRRTTEMLDAFLTDKLFGFPIFIFMLWLMFQSTFTLGSYPMDWIDGGIAYLSGLFNTYLPDGQVKDLLVDGILGGVGGVIIFLPNILILFFFISLMEDTGYMARAVFIMDRLMHKMGLHGKSFIPLIMGFGCNVPAIMATRTIENRNNRLVTMLINPLMSCSARLPVHILLIGAFFPKHQGSMLFLVYFIGIALAVGIAIILNKYVFVAEEQPFVMELPPYRVPTARSTVKHMWNKASEYLKKMGGVILVASVIIWALENYPKNVEYSQPYDDQIEELSNRIGLETEIGGNVEEQIYDLELQKEGERQAKSYLGQIGKTIEPVLRPLGFDWKLGVSLLSGIAAKEIVVSTMGVIFQAEASPDEGTEKLVDKLRSAKFQSGVKAGEPLFTNATALAFILFILIYFPCVAVVASIKRESGNWKWAVISILYSTGLAWFVAFAVYQIGSLFA